MRLILTKCQADELRPGDLYTLHERHPKEGHMLPDLQFGWIVWLRHDEPIPIGRESEIVYRIEVHQE